MLLAESTVHSNEAFLLSVMIQLMVIIAAARLGAWLFGKLGQPQVVGEIAAGLLLGPSCFGRLFPDVSTDVFVDDAAVIQVFLVLGQLGLILLMFLIGLEFEFAHLKRLGRTAASVAIAGIVLPFGLGLGLAAVMYSQVAPELNRLGFMLFMATALSITAIPVLGRIMLEFRLTRTPLGVLTISAAAVDDALGWILLAAISAIVAGGFEPAAVGKMLGWTLGFFVACLFVVRPLVIAGSRRWLVGADGQLSLPAFSMLLTVVLLSAVTTNVIGIFSIFGPFVVGAVLWDQEVLHRAVMPKLKDFVNAFFLPIFFTYTGLRTDVGLLNTPQMWLFCGLVSLAAIVGKMAGCGLAARWGGMSWPETGCVAVMMNTRALMGLIAINVGRQMGVIPDSVFSMLVLMALLTTLMTSPILRRWLKRVDPSLLAVEASGITTDRVTVAE